MSEFGSSAAVGVIIATSIAQAKKASGGIVRMSPEEFQKIMNKTKAPLVVTSKGGFFNKGFRYLINYKGIFFFTKSKEPIHLPSDVEIVNSKSICIPGQ